MDIADAVAAFATRAMQETDPDALLAWTASFVAEQLGASRCVAMRPPGPASGEADLVIRCESDDGELQGTLMLTGRRPESLDPGERHLLDLVAGLAGTALAGSRLQAPLASPPDQYRELIESLRLITYIVLDDETRSAVYMSPQIEEILGYPVQQWLDDGELFGKLLHPDDRERVLAELAHAAQLGEPVVSEYRLLSRDGRAVWLRDVSVRETGAAGERIARGYLLDVTEHRLAAENLRQAEERYRRLVEELPLVTYISAADSTSSLQYMSPQVEAMLGYPVEDWLADPQFFVAVVHPDDRGQVFGEIERNIAGEALTSEYRMIAADGREVWVRDVSIPELDETGEVTAVRGFMIDVTERRRIEQEHLEAEERYRSLTEEIPAVIYVDAADEVGSTLYMSPRVVDLLGYPLELWERSPDFFTEQVLHPDDREHVLADIARNNAGEPSTTVYRCLAADGRIVWVYDESVPQFDEDGRVVCVRGYMIDITEQKRVEEERREAEERYRRLVETLPLVTYVDQPDETASTTFVSPQIEDILGYPLSDWQRDPDLFMKVLHPDDRERVLEGIARGRAGERHTSEYRLIAADGRVVWFTDMAVPDRDETGAVVAIRGFMTDITEQKRAQELHAEAEIRFQEFIERLPLVVYIDQADELYSTSYISPQATQLLGYAPEEWLERPERFREVIHPDDRDRVLTEHAAWSERGGAYESEYRMLARDGRTVWVRDRAVIVDDPASGRRSAQGYWLDITDQKRAEEELHRSEEQLRQAQKMEAVGRLAGGVAHDFNNLLTVVRGYVDFLLDEPSLSASIRNGLVEIDTATDRAVALTRQLLAFSRRQVLAPTRLDLSAVVAELHSMLRRLIGEDIELEIRSEPSLGMVQADRSQIEQVLMNLAVNARDAMPSGGRLTIETRCVDPGTHDRPELEPRRYVALSVSDTGIGMDEATQQRIFEPFFTTKEQGKGTGLGLATVHGIVEQSEGRVEVSSSPGAGATFTILLPLVADELQDADAAPDRSAREAGTETVLVVEDDAGVRRLVRTALTRAGYTVLEAGEASQALGLARDPSVRFDLLLTDVVMPGMSGRALAEELSTIRPGVPVLYMSGYTDDDIVHHGVHSAEMPFIQKPFLPTALAAKVRSVIDARRVTRAAA